MCSSETTGSGTKVMLLLFLVLRVKLIQPHWNRHTHQQRLEQSVLDTTNFFVFEGIGVGY